MILLAEDALNALPLIVTCANSWISLIEQEIRHWDALHQFEVVSAHGSPRRMFLLPSVWGWKAG